VSLFPKNLNEYVASLGIPRGPLSKAFLVDPVNGSDSNPGTTWQAPLLTLAAAEDLCTANRHDVVLFLAGATADNPAATIAWDKSYTHLIGVGSELPGLGNRCRVVNASATVMHGPVITFSGNGCMVKNMQFGNEHDGSADATGVVLVTGQRNLFENVFFMVPFETTAASYSLKITDGGENVFKNCTIGQHTCVRTAATYGLWIKLGSGEANPTRNKFINCEFLSWSAVSTHVLVNIDADISVEAFTVFFENCTFLNIDGGATAGVLGHCIVDGATNAYHRIVLRGWCFINGVAATHIADPVTYTYGSFPAAAAPSMAVVAGH
jgi:hypothetical protein